MKIKIILHLFLLCNISYTHAMETAITPVDLITDNNIKKLIKYTNENSLNIVTIIKNYAYNNNTHLNASTIAPFLNLKQEQVNKLFLETIEDDELRPLLLSMGANINAVTKHNRNCLFFTKNPDLLKEFIARGATVDIIDSHGYTPLYHLLYSSTFSSEADKAIKAAHILLEEGKANPNIIHSTFGYILHKTVNCDKENMGLKGTELLCKYNASVDVEDSCGNTPLIKAIKMGYINIVKCLLQYKANPNLPNKDEDYPLHIAMEDNSNNYYYSHEFRFFPEIVLLLLEHKADPNKLYHLSNNSLLHAAVQYKHSYVIRKLVEYGARKNYRNNNKQTPYDLAKSFNTHRIVIDIDILNLLKPDETTTTTPTQQ